MAGVMIQFDPTVFDPGNPLEAFADAKHKAKYTIEAESGRGTHIDVNVWFKDADNPQPPNSNVLVVKWGGPSWLDTPLEFNSLPYNEVRSQIANAVEKGLLQVLASTGATATVAQIRGGTVA